MKSSPNLNHLISDHEVMEYLRGKSDELSGKLQSAGCPEAESLPGLLEGLDVAGSSAAYSQTEAIVQLTGRPPLLIQDSNWQEPEIPILRERLEQSRLGLEKAIKSVGRVELYQLGAQMGTGWMIEEGVMITNRHVAEIFAMNTDAGVTLRRNADGDLIETQIDFLREHERSATYIAKIEEVIHLEERGNLHPDFSLVRLSGEGGSLPVPIELDEVNPRFNDDVAAIGYPAEDARNDVLKMHNIFDRIYNVKRLSPGKVRGVDYDGKRLIHDCTTLGGSSGSAILNLATGKVCGLHFSGSYLENNYAVSVGWLKSRLAELSGKTIVSINSSAQEEAVAPVIASGQRSGYDSMFLGGDYHVPLPKIEDPSLIAPVKEEENGELKYTHFSLVMRKDRKLPFFTACNIDGDKLFNFVRTRDKWLLDLRLEDPEHQIGQKLYSGNSLDRGHLVRRLDPTWGDTREEAKQAEQDTFYFTNCSPQHKLLNRQSWLALENYVLKNAATHQLRLSVLAGPVMAEGDRTYRDIQLPEEYWKVLVIRNTFTGQLSATGYLLSQADNLSDLEFVFGEYRTYQVAIKELEKRTNLSFGDLTKYDPLGQTEGLAQRVIAGEDDVVL